jgi:RNA polymerase sigma-70 factor, ECF subfamily
MTQAERRNRYAEAVEQHHDELRAHCTRILRSPHDAEDALQEALLRAWRSFHRFEGRGSIRAWLYRIATNASLDQLRRRREIGVDVELVDHADPEDHFERRQAAEQVVSAVSMLPRRQREAFVLREVFGLSARETASVLDGSVASVNSNLQRARVALRRRLGGVAASPRR